MGNWLVGWLGWVGLVIWLVGWVGRSVGRSTVCVLPFLSLTHYNVYIVLLTQPYVDPQYLRSYRYNTDVTWGSQN